MKYPRYVDAEMRELLDTLGEVVVPRSKRQPCTVENVHTHYYSRGRFRTL